VYDYIHVANLACGGVLYSVDRTVDRCKHCGELLALGPERVSEHFCGEACAASWAESLMAKVEAQVLEAESRMCGYKVQRRRNELDVPSWLRDRQND
jgi:hypothetical protein